VESEHINRHDSMADWPKQASQPRSAAGAGAMKAEDDELKKLRELVVNQNLFLAATAHDLRQPLHAIGLFLSAINSELEAATDIANARLRIGAILRRLERSMQGVDDEIQRLLDWSRLQSGAVLPNRKEFALKPLMETLEARFAPLALARGLRFRTAICRDVLVNTDAALLVEILMNLLSNAFKYTNQGTVLFSARKRGTEMLLQVWDTGPGMQPLRAIDSPLEPVQVTRTDLARGKSGSKEASRGLGLSIVLKLATTLAYSVQYRSADGVGSVFSLRVPIAASNRLNTVNSVTTGPDLGILRGKMILVVDDEVDILWATESALRGLGMFVLIARNLAEAQRAVEAGERFPDILLTDHHVAEHRSDQIISHMRGVILTDFAILVVTGESDPAALASMRQQGLEPLMKPLSFDSLALALVRTLSR
jgi:two-component system, sensor histidine kinase